MRTERVEFRAPYEEKGEITLTVRPESFHFFDSVSENAID